jgi:carbonic anhydrase
MKRLIEGALRFQGEVYPAHRDLFRELASTQQPDTLLITCSDSRVVPDLIVQAKPGDVFICRNAGNIVPSYGDVSGGVSATIEYAVLALNVSHIIICGHSDCGAMKALIHPEKLHGMPNVTRWLRNAAPADAIVRESRGHLDEPARLAALIEENVLAQLDNLRTHPYVAARLRSGALALHGWVYDIESGAIRVYNRNGETTSEQPSFVALSHPTTEGAEIHV